MRNGTTTCNLHTREAIIQAEKSKTRMTRKRRHGKKECAICLEKRGQQKRLQCNHAFHEECLAAWYKVSPHRKNQCPFCQELKREYKNISNEIWLTANAKQCPQCGIYIQKEGGCNRVTCRCGCRFTYSKTWDYNMIMDVMDVLICLLFSLLITLLIVGLVKIFVNKETEVNLLGCCKNENPFIGQTCRLQPSQSHRVTLMCDDSTYNLIELEDITNALGFIKDLDLEYTFCPNVRLRRTLSNRFWLSWAELCNHC